MKNAQLAIGLKYLKRDKFLLISVFLLIFILIYWLGLMFPQEGDPSFLEGLEGLLENPLYQFLIGPAISVTTIKGWLALGWLSYSWWVGLPLGIYLGVKVLAMDLNQGTADQLFVTPVSRRIILISRTAIALLESLIVPVSSSIGIITVYLVFDKENPLPMEELILIFLLDYFFILVVIFLTIFMSLIITELRKIILLISGYYFGSFFMLTFSGMSQDFEFLRDFSIFKTRPVVDVFINSNLDEVVPDLLFLLLLSLILFTTCIILIDRIEIRSKMG